MNGINERAVITPQTRELYEALVTRGVFARLEYTDGHKHVDIAILNARMFIEVDGLQHFTDPIQITRDFKRDHFSDGDDFATLRIPNIVLEHHLQEVVDAVVRVVEQRRK